MRFGVGRIAVTKYLAHIDRDRRLEPMRYLDHELALSLQEFSGGGNDEQESVAKLASHGSVEELLAVASAARWPAGEAVRGLTELVERTHGVAKSAAEILLHQRTTQPGGRSSDG